MPVITAYFVIRATVEILEGEAENAVSRVAEDGEYKLEHEDDICKVVDTELIHATDDPKNLNV